MHTPHQLKPIETNVSIYKREQFVTLSQVFREWSLLEAGYQGWLSNVVLCSKRTGAKFLGFSMPLHKQGSITGHSITLYPFSFLGKTRLGSGSKKPRNSFPGASLGSSNTGQTKTCWPAPLLKRMQELGLLCSQTWV